MSAYPAAMIHATYQRHCQHRSSPSHHCDRLLSRITRCQGLLVAVLYKLYCAMSTVAFCPRLRSAVPLKPSCAIFCRAGGKKEVHESLRNFTWTFYLRGSLLEDGLRASVPFSTFPGLQILHCRKSHKRTFANRWRTRHKKYWLFRLLALSVYLLITFSDSSEGSFDHIPHTFAGKESIFLRLIVYTSLFSSI